MKYMINIYTISDANKGHVYYVGATKHSLKVRMCGHVSTNKLFIFKDPSITPVIELIERVDEEIAGQTELYWIGQFRAWGFNILNTLYGRAYRYKTIEAFPKKRFAEKMSIDTLDLLNQVAKENHRTRSNMMAYLIHTEAERLGLQPPCLNNFPLAAN